MSFFPQPSSSKILVAGTTIGSNVGAAGTTGPASGKEWNITNITLTNNSGAAIEQTIEINNGSNILFDIVVIQHNGRVDLGSLHLNNPQYIRFLASTGINYIVYGIELG